MSSTSHRITPCQIPSDGYVHPNLLKEFQNKYSASHPTLLHIIRIQNFPTGLHGIYLVVILIFPALPDDIENVVEATADINDWN
jgi:hypothetical protein